MANYRDPKVTTPTQKSSMGKWIGIALAVIAVIILLWWLMADRGGPATTGVPQESPVVDTAPPATTPPATTPPATAPTD